MRFDCFYYPTVNDDGKVIRSNINLKEFEFGDLVPTKTLYYNYSKNFAIYQGEEFYIVEDGILTQSISSDNLKFPLKIVFGKGRQLKIFSKKDLPSIRLLLKGEFEKEKELGELFCLSLMLNKKIKHIQYGIMSDLTNSSRDCDFLNQEIDNRTHKLIEDLKIVERKFYSLTLDYPNLKDSYLKYMNFSDKEDLLEISINKYFKPESSEYKHYLILHSMCNSKPIYPKFKLDNLISSFNYKI